MSNSNWSWGPGLDKFMKKVKKVKLIIKGKSKPYEQRRNTSK